MKKSQNKAGAEDAAKVKKFFGIASGNIYRLGDEQRSVEYDEPTPIVTDAVSP